MTFSRSGGENTQDELQHLVALGCTNVLQNESSVGGVAKGQGNHLNDFPMTNSGNI